MRLSKKYIDVFIKVISNYIANYTEGNSKAELRLFGSRLNDDLKGGDIDLLLIVESQAIEKKLKQKKAEIFGKIFLEIEEQKIDLLIISAAELPNHPFAAMAYDKSQLLFQWP